MPHQIPQVSGLRFGALISCRLLFPMVPPESSSKLLYRAEYLDVVFNEKLIREMQTAGIEPDFLADLFQNEDICMRLAVFNDNWRLNKVSNFETAKQSEYS
ncbi:uncharacterized protein LOC121996712 [Zingiber officinale]|uniref:uncharacterized protein LOC121996712 n=1 Tax=Zingiber officinale TaxID=94328 RepID=UPI001C4AF50E|nr:uncharacterized protein LOC121996712 [Zingiber officinale]